VAGQTVGQAKLYEAIGPVLEQAIDCLQQAAHSPMSIWEFREARRTLEKQGAKVINEGLIFRSYEQMRAIEEHARTETKHIRRKNQQRRHNQKICQPKASGEKALSETERSDSDYAFPIVRPFDELEELSL
jgi:putative transposase